MTRCGVRGAWCGVLLALGTASCRDAFTTNVTVVASAGSSELTVDRLAEIFAQGKALVVKRDVIERVARLWVDYSLFAQRNAEGDSLLDSATVVQTLWPEVQQRRADLFHELLMAKHEAFDTTKVDSIYAAGEYRLFQHVVFRTQANSAPPEREKQRAKARQVRSELARGGTWAVANRVNEDLVAKANGGLIGVVVRGETPPAFENAAWALEPGQVSDVVETGDGFHVVRRPVLRELRSTYAREMGNRVTERQDSAYLGGLGERRHVRVKPQAPPMVRAALADPFKATTSTATLGTFDGGSFSVSDLVRWISALEPAAQERVSRATDEQIVLFVRSLMRNHALMVEADSAGVVLTPADIEEFRDLLRRDLAMTRKALGLTDTALAKATPTDRRRFAALYVDHYLEGIAANKVDFAGVPPFLAAQLRQRYPWRVSSAGVDRVFERSSQLRGLVDSLAPASPPAPVVDSGGANAKR